MHHQKQSCSRRQLWRTASRRCSMQLPRCGPSPDSCGQAQVQHPSRLDKVGLQVAVQVAAVVAVTVVDMLRVLLGANMTNQHLPPKCQGSAGAAVQSICLALPRLEQQARHSSNSCWVTVTSNAMQKRRLVQWWWSSCEVPQATVACWVYLVHPAPYSTPTSWSC